MVRVIQYTCRYKTKKKKNLQILARCTPNVHMVPIIVGIKSKTFFENRFFAVEFNRQIGYGHVSRKTTYPPWRLRPLNPATGVHTNEQASAYICFSKKLFLLPRVVHLFSNLPAKRYKAAGRSFSSKESPRAKIVSMREKYARNDYN